MQTSIASGTTVQECCCESSRSHRQATGARTHAPWCPDAGGIERSAGGPWTAEATLVGARVEASPCRSGPPLSTQRKTPRRTTTAKIRAVIIAAFSRTERLPDGRSYPGAGAPVEAPPLVPVAPRSDSRSPELNGGKTSAACCQSRQPSCQTRESGPTRPSAIQVRMTSLVAGPNCPPLAGRTYQTASGDCASGSVCAGDGEGDGEEAGWAWAPGASGGSAGVAEVVWMGASAPGDPVEEGRDVG